MKLEPEITYRDLEPTESIEAKIRDRLERLDRRHPGIMACRVAIESHHRHHKGNLYHLRVDLTLPGHELVVSRDPKDHHAHEDLYVAIRDAFDAMERQLEGLAQRQRREVKSHETPPHGRVAELAEEHGRIETLDGRSIYFHRNAVLDDAFGALAVGSEVRYVEQRGDEGPQASGVSVIGKPHPAE